MGPRFEYTYSLLAVMCGDHAVSLMLEKHPDHREDVFIVLGHQYRLFPAR